MSKDNTIFDDVFRTLLEKMPQLVIPLVNEVFHTTYDKNTEIVQLRNDRRREMLRSVELIEMLEVPFSD